MLNHDVLQKVLDETEQKITDLCVKDDGLVPSKLDRQQIKGLGHKLEDLTDGKNTVVFDREGHPNCTYVLEPEYKNSIPYLSGSGTYFDVPASGPTNNLTTHSCFLANDGSGISTYKIMMGKYSMVRFNNKNVPASLFGLPPAHSSTTASGKVPAFTVSYNGVADRLAITNSSTDYEEGERVHNITAEEYALLHMKAVREGFMCHGNSNYGHWYGDATERGVNCGYFDTNGGNRPLHVKTGSGPMTWRHDGTPYGICAAGDAFRILHGIYFAGGVLRVIPYNNVALMEPAEHRPTATVDSATQGWKELDETGVYVDCDGENTWRCDYTTTPPESGSAKGRWVLAQEFIQSTNTPTMSAGLSQWSVPEGLTIPWRIQELCLYPSKTGNLNGPLQVRNFPGSVYVCVAGGHYNNGGNLSFGYRYCYSWLAGSNSYNGTAVPCFLRRI